jgi:tRNA(Ile)-lysidine synthase
MAENSYLHYHFFVREKVLRYIRERKLMRAGDRVCVAVSGGADSVALLRVLLELRNELGIVISVAHFNHLLRGEASDTDQAFTSALAREHELEFFTIRGEVQEIAEKRKKGLEETARELRYGWLKRIAESGRKLDKIATGHTLDDLAETVLMKFLRGAGTRGLAGIFPQLDPGTREYPLSASRLSFHGSQLVRPLLGVTRAEVEDYLTTIGQKWREDESNRDLHFQRNRVRHQLLPLLEREYNPNIRQVLSEVAEVARAEEEYWNAVASEEIALRTPSRQSLRLDGFAELPLAVQRRVLRRFLTFRSCDAGFEHIENALHCAFGEIEKTTLPGDYLAWRQGTCLQLLTPQEQQARVASGGGYEYRVMIPGMVHVEEIGLTLQTVVVPRKLVTGEARSSGSLMSAELLGPELMVRNWRPGDRFHPVHSGSEQKLKRLFSERHVPAGQRSSWPLALYGSQIVWVRGFPVARAFAWRGSGDAVKIEVC